MANLVSITVAAGCHIAIVPHPSGLPGLRSLTLHGGEVAQVTQQRADELFRAGLIHNPVTGEAPAPLLAAETSTTIQYSGRPKLGAVVGQPTVPDWRDSAEHPDLDATPPSPSASRTGPSVTNYADFPSLAPIVDADGRPWPSY